jgi:hypothetical protein
LQVNELDVQFAQYLLIVIALEVLAQPFAFAAASLGSVEVALGALQTRGLSRPARQNLSSALNV